MLNHAAIEYIHLHAHLQVVGVKYNGVSLENGYTCKTSTGDSILDHAGSSWVKSVDRARRIIETDRDYLVD